MIIHNDLSKEKLEEIEQFFKTRQTDFENLRNPLDDIIKEDIDIYNDLDKYIEEKEWYEEKQTIPYIYTIVQTMVARLYQVFFGKENYLRIYTEDKSVYKEEKEIQRWLQFEMDKIKIKDRSRDMFETALVKRTSWVQLRPIPHPTKKGKIKTVDFDILDWFDVWFDTKAKTIYETDFIVRKRVKLWELIQAKEHYFNLDEVKASQPPDDIKQRQTYTAENETSYYDPTTNNVTDEVEIKERYGYYDFGTEKKPDFKPCIITRANDTVIIRVETLEELKELEYPFLIYPIRPLKQANSLIAKSIPQITRKQQYAMNDALSLTMDNFRLLIKMLFKYKKDGSVDFDELYAGGGNAIGFEDSPDDVSIFAVPNVLNVGISIVNYLIQFMQQTTGAVDYLMGTSAGSGITETAKGIQTITEQALFKFQMMAENVYGDLKDLITSMIVILVKFGDHKSILKRFKVGKFLKQSIEDIESGYLIDIEMNDLAQRRDIERAQFINAINVIGGLMQSTGGGNMKELLRQVMERLNMENIDEILELPPEVKKQMEMQQQMMLMQQAAQQGGNVQGALANQNAGPAAASPEAVENQTTANGPQGA